LIGPFQIIEKSIFLCKRRFSFTIIERSYIVFILLFFYVVCDEKCLPYFLWFRIKKLEAKESQVLQQTVD
jgi:hypothetical protein